jgi:hypothetical protein
MSQIDMLLAKLERANKHISDLEPEWRSFSNGGGYSILGSAQKLVEGRILGRFPEDDEFGLGGRHPLRLQQEVTEILIAPATP